MIIRFGDLYEVAKIDRHNWAVFRVMPEGFDNSKARLRTSEDGRALKHTGTYHQTPRAAVEKAGQLLAEDGLCDPSCGSVADALAEVERAVHAAAEAVQRGLCGA